MELHVAGTTVTIDTSALTAVQRRELAHLWEWATGPATGATTDITLGATTDPDLPTTLSVRDWDHAPYAISCAITTAAIRRQVGTGTLLLHAAGLADADGAVLVCYGPPGAGKTTAARALGTTLGYVSDETIAIAPDGRVHPHTKPLSTVRGLGAGKAEVSPADAGLRRPPPNLHLGRAVLLLRDTTTPEPRLEPMDLIDGLATAIPQTSGLTSLPSPLARLARTLTEGGNPVRLRYREISQCTGILTNLLARPEPPTVEWAHHPPTGSSPAPRTWIRSSYTDAVSSAGRVLVLTPDRTVFLDGVGALAWLAAEPGVTQDAVEAAAVEAFGPHAQSSTVVDGVLGSLADAGVLSVA